MSNVSMVSGVKVVPHTGDEWKLNPVITQQGIILGEANGKTTFWFAGKNYQPTLAGLEPVDRGVKRSAYLAIETIYKCGYYDNPVRYSNTPLAQTLSALYRSIGRDDLYQRAKQTNWKIDIVIPETITERFPGFNNVVEKPDFGVFSTGASLRSIAYERVSLSLKLQSHHVQSGRGNVNLTVPMRTLQVSTSCLVGSGLPTWDALFDENESIINAFCNESLSHRKK